MKRFLGITFFISFVGFGQQVTKTFDLHQVKANLDSLKHAFGTHKSIPLEFEAPILVALSFYPELKQTTIVFRVKKTKTPLTSRPNFWGLFRNAKKRTYYVTLSEQSTPELNPILFKNLDFNAQIGVIGHELAHVSAYCTQSLGGILRLGWIHLFSKKNVDAFENSTDRRCIQHGLGYQLLDWSIAVRTRLNRKEWRGVSNLSSPQHSSERYLNPDTIRALIKENPLYGQQ